MTLQQQINEKIDKIYAATVEIKSLEEDINFDPENIKLKTKMVEILLEYESNREATVRLLDQYFKEEQNGTTRNFNYHALRRKLTA